MSTTDTESGYYVKDERVKMFVYSYYTASDPRGFILTGANVHDSRMLELLVNQLIENVGKPAALAVDAGYKTPAIANFWMD